MDFWSLSSYIPAFHSAQNSSVFKHYTKNSCISNTLSPRLRMDRELQTRPRALSCAVTVTALWSTDRHYQLMLCRVSQSQWWSHSTRELDFPLLMAPAHERDPYQPVEQTGGSEPKSCPKIPPRFRRRSRMSSRHFSSLTLLPQQPEWMARPSKQSHSLSGDKWHWTEKNAAWSIWGEIILNKDARWREEIWPEARAKKGTRGW